MIIKPRCKQSFMAIVHIKRRIKIVQRIIFVLLILQMSALFSYKLGIVCLVLTCLMSLGTIMFILIEQSNQILAFQRALYSLCTQALIDHLESHHYSNNVGETLSTTTITTTTCTTKTTTFHLLLTR